MSNIFENDSDCEVEIRTDNEYAKSYNVWRKKEEINKIKTKYGDDIDLAEESSSSSDDEEGVELTETIEKDFFKTLAYLKNKDPRIYDEGMQFFQDKAGSSSSLSEKKKKKDTPMYLKDYERKIILENGGVFSDDEDSSEIKSKSTTYVEEQNNIKESLKNALSAVDDDKECEEGWGGLFQERKKTQEEKETEDSDYKKWLAGDKEKIDEEVETELKPLKDYWNNPNLDEGEKFLRDYILNKKFLEKDNDDYIPTYDEIIHDSDQDLSNDENTIEAQEEFEHKYNFRFEEPDQEFIKRYPRTLENSVRKKDDRRKVKRQETKERKKKEKEEKMKELKKLQEFKRKEIEEKLEKLKEITGNTDIEFMNEDIDGDFDPEAHDKRMQALFNDDYYQGPEEEQKPVFPEIDEELEIENWDRYEPENEGESQNAPHCEDDDFNMDCEYDPTGSTQNELIERSKGKKKRKRKSKVAEALSKPKPKFDPNDKNYDKYFDEYYKLDCEDIIGDIPCRFKYRKVVPNDFGLSIEEILLAKERELNKWCSLKKTVQIRPDQVEKYEQIAYKKKAQNINLKKKILPSLFTPDPKEENDEDIIESDKSDIKLNDSTIVCDSSEQVSKNENNEQHKEENIPDNTKVSSKKKKKKRKNNGCKMEAENNKVNGEVNDSTIVRDSSEQVSKNENNEQHKVENISDKTKISTKKKKKKKKNSGSKMEAENNKVNGEVNDSTIVRDSSEQVSKNENNEQHKVENISDKSKISNKKKKKRKNNGSKMEAENNKVKGEVNDSTIVRNSSEQVSKNENNEQHIEDNISDQSKIANKKKKKRKNSGFKKEAENNKGNGADQSQSLQRKRKASISTNEIEVSRKKVKKNGKNIKNKKLSISDARLSAYGINPKKYKNKLKYGNK